MLALQKILTFPEGYQRMPYSDEDPVGCVNYAVATAEAQGMIQAYPVPKEEMTNLGNAEELIDGLHETMEEDRALIEVEDGTNANGMPYLYSIVKSKQAEEGTQYTLMFYGLCGADAFCVRGLFAERGEKGKREQMVWNYLKDRGVVSAQDSSKWERDPYDRTLVRPYLMNLSERADFDEAFPDHPLSLCRALIRFWKGDSEEGF